MTYGKWIRWMDWRKWRIITVGWGYGGTNYHGRKLGGPGSGFATVKGPRLKWVKLNLTRGGVGRRLIYYNPSGSWVYLDFYLVVRKP